MSLPAARSLRFRNDTASTAPERSRRTTWKEFLTRHWELIVAADFFTVEVWTRRGLQRFIVLFFIQLSTRKVEIAGIASVANGLWMSQIGRNLTDALDGILKGKRYLIHDRDPLFTTKFLDILADVSVKSVKLPARSPNPNAHAERFVRTIEESCLERMILLGEESLRTAIHNFVAHEHTERNHQGLANRLISPEPGHAAPATGRHAELLGRQYKPLPSTSSRPSAPPASLRTRCDDAILKARGECIDTSAGVKPVQPGEKLPENLNGVAGANSRDLVFAEEQRQTVVSSPNPLSGPIIYELRLARR
jgi:transposase InsO family protein